MSANPITKIWVMALKDPSTTPSTNSTLHDLLEEVLAFCHSASGTQHAAHQFWQDENEPATLALITGYPSAAVNVAADKEYVARGYLERMAVFVESKKLVQVEVSVKDLPLDAEIMGVEMVEERDEDRGVGGSHSETAVVTQGSEIERGKPTKNVSVTFTRSNGNAGLGSRDGKQLLKKILG